MKDLESILERLHAARILIVGDLILDQYIWGEVHRISPEAPIPVVEVVREDFTLGGASNVANNVRALGASVEISGLVGEDGYGRMLVDRLREGRIGTRGVVEHPGRPTTLKTRIVAHKQQVVRVDREQTGEIESALLAEMRTRIESLLPEADALILEDYGKGVIQEELLRHIVPLARNAGKVVTVDPKKDHFTYYQGVTAITPNRTEAEAFAEIRIRDASSLREAGAHLMERLRCDAVLLTLGEQGMCLVERDAEPYEIPAHARDVFDVSGAGDTVIAVFTTALVAGASLRQAAVLSNIAGGLVVEKLGTATVTVQEIRRRLREVHGTPG